MFTCIFVTRCSDFNDNKGHTKRRWSAYVLACIAGAGFVVAQEEISRECARRKGEEASSPTRVITSHGLKKCKWRLLRVTKSYAACVSETNRVKTGTVPSLPRPPFLPPLYQSKQYELRIL